MQDDLTDFVEEVNCHPHEILTLLATIEAKQKELEGYTVTMEDKAKVNDRHALSAELEDALILEDDVQDYQLEL
jgi:hypothetical protein